MQLVAQDAGALPQLQLRAELFDAQSGILPPLRTRYAHCSALSLKFALFRVRLPAHCPETQATKAMSSILGPTFQTLKLSQQSFAGPETGCDFMVRRATIRSLLSWSGGPGKWVVQMEL